MSERMETLQSSTYEEKGSIMMMNQKWLGEIMGVWGASNFSCFLPIPLNCLCRFQSLCFSVLGLPQTNFFIKCMHSHLKTQTRPGSGALICRFGSCYTSAAGSVFDLDEMPWRRKLNGTLSAYYNKLYQAQDKCWTHPSALPLPYQHICGPIWFSTWSVSGERPIQ